MGKGSSGACATTVSIVSHDMAIAGMMRFIIGIFTYMHARNANTTRGRAPRPVTDSAGTLREIPELGLARSGGAALKVP